MNTKMKGYDSNIKNNMNAKMKRAWKGNEYTNGRKMEGLECNHEKNMEGHEYKNERI